MTARRLSPILFAAMLAAASPAIARPHAAVPAAPMLAHPQMHLAGMKHMVPPALPRVQVPVPLPVFVPVYIPYAAFGWPAFNAFGMTGLNAGLCQSLAAQNATALNPPTLGALGTAGAGSWFAPVSLNATPSFDTIPSAQQPWSPAAVCAPPGLNFLNLSIGN
ncbi:MAG: hypothetical protein JO060_07510 [Candidatus Eremiobacteraeota bacterium]|nr:hypothetical protein [Candidatus Eremiobacteraeota bacterium]